MRADSASECFQTGVAPAAPSDSAGAGHFPVDAWLSLDVPCVADLAYVQLRTCFGPVDDGVVVVRAVRVASRSGWLREELPEVGGGGKAGGGGNACAGVGGGGAAAGAATAGAGSAAAGAGSAAASAGSVSLSLEWRTLLLHSCQLSMPLGPLEGASSSHLSFLHSFKKYCGAGSWRLLLRTLNLDVRPATAPAATLGTPAAFRCLGHFFDAIAAATTSVVLDPAAASFAVCAARNLLKWALAADDRGAVETALGGLPAGSAFPPRFFEAAALLLRATAPAEAGFLNHYELRKIAPLVDAVAKELRNEVAGGGEVGAGGAGGGGGGDRNRLLAAVPAGQPEKPFLPPPARPAPPAPASPAAEAHGALILAVALECDSETLHAILDAVPIPAAGETGGGGGRHDAAAGAVACLVCTPVASRITDVLGWAAGKASPRTLPAASAAAAAGAGSCCQGCRRGCAEATDNRGCELLAPKTARAWGSGGGGAGGAPYPPPHSQLLSFFKTAAAQPLRFPCDPPSDAAAPSTQGLARPAPHPVRSPATRGWGKWTRGGGGDGAARAAQPSVGAGKTFFPHPAAAPDSAAAASATCSCRCGSPQLTATTSCSSGVAGGKPLAKPRAQPSAAPAPPRARLQPFQPPPLRARLPPPTPPSASLPPPLDRQLQLVFSRLEALGGGPAGASPPAPAAPAAPTAPLPHWADAVVRRHVAASEAKKHEDRQRAEERVAARNAHLARGGGGGSGAGPGKEAAWPTVCEPPPPPAPPCACTRRPSLPAALSAPLRFSVLSPRSSLAASSPRELGEVWEGGEGPPRAAALSPAPEKLAAAGEFRVAAWTERSNPSFRLPSGPPSLPPSSDGEADDSEGNSLSLPECPEPPSPVALLPLEPLRPAEEERLAAIAGRPTSTSDTDGGSAPDVDSGSDRRNFQPGHSRRESSPRRQNPTPASDGTADGTEKGRKAAPLERSSETRRRFGKNAPARTLPERQRGENAGFAIAESAPDRSPPPPPPPPAAAPKTAAGAVPRRSLTALLEKHRARRERKTLDPPPAALSSSAPDGSPVRNGAAATIPRPGSSDDAAAPRAKAATQRSPAAPGHAPRSRALGEFFRQQLARGAGGAAGRDRVDATRTSAMRAAATAALRAGSPAAARNPRSPAEADSETFERFLNAHAVF